MNFLGLPPEIVHLVFSFVVISRGLRRAMRIRRVNRGYPIPVSIGTEKTRLTARLD